MSSGSDAFVRLSWMPSASAHRAHGRFRLRRRSDEGRMQPRRSICKDNGLLAVKRDALAPEHRPQVSYRSSNCGIIRATGMMTPTGAGLAPRVGGRRMISAYDVTDGLLRKLDCSNDGTDLVEATWVDLLNPTAEREAAVEAALSVAIFPREAVREIDASSQICRENGSLVMTARMISRNEASGLRLVPATCILKSGTLSGEAVMAGLPAGPSAGALRARLCSAGARWPPNPAMT